MLTLTAHARQVPRSMRHSLANAADWPFVSGLHAYTAHLVRPRAGIQVCGCAKLSRKATVDDEYPSSGKVRPALIDMRRIISPREHCALGGNLRVYLMLIMLFAHLVGGCNGRRADGELPGSHHAASSFAGQGIHRDVSAGVVRVLTYNVAGLPGFLSASRPATNHALVSPLLNHYDLVFAQEDFAYHDDLVGSAQHLYQLSPRPPMHTLFGDGLCGLSVFPLDLVRRVRWSGCYGYLGYASDCFGEKGFSVARARLVSHVTIDIYNLHADAGDSGSDMQTRRRGFQQLAAYINRHSARSPIIVAGDTNLDARDEYDTDTFQAFIDATNLSDACHVLGCASPGLDRVMFRSSERLKLEVRTHGVDHRFVDHQGRALSDHEAIAVELAWQDLARLNPRTQE